MSSSLGLGLVVADVLGLGDGSGVAVGSPLPGATPDPAVGVGVGRGVDAGVGRSVGRGVGFGVGREVDLGVGFGVGSGVAFGVGAGVGVGLIVTVPAASVSENRSRLKAATLTTWDPTGRRPDQRNVTPRFQSVPLTRAMAWPVPPIVTRTQFAGDPSRLRYDTVTTMAVVGYPERGETAASDSLVGPAAAHTGTTLDRTSARAASEATDRPRRPSRIKGRDRVPG
jgi:hypothetical protein